MGIACGIVGAGSSMAFRAGKRRPPASIRGGRRLVRIIAGTQSEGVPHPDAGVSKDREAPIDIVPTGDHPPVIRQVVPRTTIQNPACCPSAARAQVVPGAVRVEPAGRHRTRGCRVVHSASIREPAEGHHSLAAEVVPGAVVVQPSGHHRTTGAQVVPGATAVQPPGDHRTRRPHVVPGSLNARPASGHIARASIEPVPGAGVVQPTVMGASVVR